MRGSLPARTRLWTLVCALAAFLPVRRLWGPGFATDFLAAALWATAGFWLVEALVRRALAPPAQRAGRGAIALLVLAKLAWYALAGWALLTRRVSAPGCLAGFTLLLLVLVVAGTAARSNLTARPGPSDQGHRSG